MNTRFGLSVSLALLDQAILSAFNLGLNLALIALTGPEEFGRFILASTLILIAASLQNALVAAPISVLLPGRAGEDQQSLLTIVGSFDRLLRLAASIAAAAICALSDSSPLFLCAVAAATFATLSRETVRVIRFAHERAMSVLLLDAGMVACAVLVSALLWKFLPPTTALLAGTAVGNAVALVLLAPRELPHRLGLRETFVLYRPYFVDTRWSLAGVTTTELQRRFYVFALEFFRSTVVLASVQAGRLLLGPMALAAAALGRVARPAIARAFAEGRSDKAKQLLWGCQSFVVAIMMVYFGALYFAWPLLESWIFKGRYVDIEQMTLAWSVHAFISVSEASLAMFLQAAYRLKELAYITMIAASVSSLLLLGLTLDVAPIYAVVAVIVGEVIVLVLTIRLVWRVLARLTPDVSAATGPDHAGSQ